MKITDAKSNTQIPSFSVSGAITILHALLIMIEGFIFSFVNIFHALLYLHF